jgi:hypothetical protein
MGAAAVGAAVMGAAAVGAAAMGAAATGAAATGSKNFITETNLRIYDFRLLNLVFACIFK